MSTRSSVAWDDAYHLYVELLDDRLWLDVEVDAFEVCEWKGEGPLRIRLPLPPGLIKTVFLPRYRHLPPTAEQRRRRAKRGRESLDRLLRALEEGRKGGKAAAAPKREGDTAPSRARRARGANRRAGRGRSRELP